MALRQWILLIFIAWITYRILGIFDRDDFDPASLKGKNIIVTGASSGIGEQTAYHYARYGANVFITARRKDLLIKVVEACKELGPGQMKYGYLSADMNIEEDRVAVIQAAQELFGDVDQLILNHAYIPPVSRWTASDSDVQLVKDTMNINVVAFVHLTALAQPSLRRTGGSVAVLSSIAGRLPSPLMPAYVASKFALDGYFSALRHEFMASKQNVSITLCIIGVVLTDSGKDTFFKVLEHVKTPSETILKFLEWTSGSPEDAGHAIVRATTRRQSELYFPPHQMLGLQGLLRMAFPVLFESSNIMELTTDHDIS